MKTIFTIRPRNKIVEYMIQRNGDGTHQKPYKSNRRKDKQDLNKIIKEKSNEEV